MPQWTTGRHQGGRSMARRLIQLIVHLLSVSLAGSSQHHPSGIPMSSFTTQEKIGQMLETQVYGELTLHASGDYALTLEQIRRYHIGSVDLRVRLDGPNLQRLKPEVVATTLNRLQSVSKIPLLVGADIERGLAVRMSDVPDMPNVMAWSASGDPNASLLAGEIIGEQARSVGIHWAFAPVVDVNDDANNPVIGDRSFGDDSDQVGRMAAAFIQGARSKNLLTTAKHFPGHGSTDTDSHVAIVNLSESLSRLKQVEFPPFEKAISVGVDAVMLAHARVPALDKEPKKITTNSQKIIEGTLRHELGFRGVVITDSMEMRGLTELYRGELDPTGRAAVDAIKAGADIIMVPDHIENAYNAILHAVQTGDIPESRIDQSVQRIFAMKERAGLFKQRLVDVSKIEGVMSKPSSWQLAQQIADGAVTLVRDESVPLPLKELLSNSSTDTNAKRTVLVLMTDSRRSPLGNTFEEEFKKRNPDAQIRHIYYDNRSAWETGDLLSTVRTADSFVIAAFMTNLPGKVDVAGGKIVQVVGLNGASAELFKQMINIAGSKAMVISLGSPYLILKYPTIQNYICTFSISSTSERAAVKALFGEIQNNARLPVNLPGVAERGFAIPWPQKTSSVH